MEKHWFRFSYNRRRMVRKYDFCGDNWLYYRKPLKDLGYNDGIQQMMFKPFYKVKKSKIYTANILDGKTATLSCVTPKATFSSSKLLMCNYNFQMLQQLEFQNYLL